MKSCLGILITFTTLVAVLGGGALIWYLSSTAEISRNDSPPTAAVQIPAAVPKAKLVR